MGSTWAPLKLFGDDIYVYEYVYLDAYTVYMYIYMPKYVCIPIYIFLPFFWNQSFPGIPMSPTLEEEELYWKGVMQRAEQRGPPEVRQTAKRKEPEHVVSRIRRWRPVPWYGGGWWMLDVLDPFLGGWLIEDSWRSISSS